LLASLPDVDVVLEAVAVAYLPTAADLPFVTEFPAFGNLPSGGVSAIPVC
jgi:hypothetical protein